MAQDLYQSLGVPRSADAETIKKAYRKLAKDLHPDRHPGDKQAEAKFKSVNHAYDILSNPQKRKLYDEFGEAGLREGFDPEQARAYRAWSSRQQGGGGGRGSSQFDFEDLFGAERGGGGGFGDVFGDMFGRTRRGPRKGMDLEAEATIDFASSLRGAMLELAPRAQGTSEEGRGVTVRVPAGAADGQRVRIAGQGMPSSSGGPPGDLIILLHVTPHPHFRRDGDDLHLDLPITISEAFSGAKVKVPTIEGHVSLKVPERAQSGTVVRLRGKGVARKGHAPGDLYVHFLVQIPAGDEPELKKLVDQLARFEESDVRRDVKL